jgi:hypothetical protein
MGAQLLFELTKDLREHWPHGLTVVEPDSVVPKYTWRLNGETLFPEQAAALFLAEIMGALWGSGHSFQIGIHPRGFAVRVDARDEEYHDTPLLAAIAAFRKIKG